MIVNPNFRDLHGLRRKLNHATLDDTVKQPHFYLLFPNIFGYMGGIQVYSAVLLRALQELYPEAEYDVFLKYDRSDKVNLQNLEFLPQTRFHYFGQSHGDRNLWRRYGMASLAAAKMVGLGLWQRPTLILTTHLDFYSVVFDWFKRLTGVPYGVVLHGLEAWNVENAALKAVLQRADQVMAVSHYTRDRLLREQSLPSDHVTVLPNAFDASRFKIAPKPNYLLERYGLTPDQPVILTVSRLDQNTGYKGYNQIIQALVEIRHHIPNAHYVLAGKGNNVPYIEALVHQLNLQDCVTLTGFVPESELCDHYNLCDVFALPSRGEGFGIVYLEALACGKPVLAGNQDGAVDPLLNGEIGCLVDPDDVEAIAKNLTQILQGTHPNSLLGQPEILRRKTIENFEFAQFRRILSQSLQSLQLPQI
ncbi:glycosyltransferase [Trichocoleus desertorum AS-A10]|uniref:glycosyltransferase n=1 Tax=Trichocoleus desertorum TaxID=1481672 RepID=UPI003297164C